MNWQQSVSRDSNRAEDSLCLVMAQLNFVVGDIPGNTRRILEAAKQAMQDHAADLVVFPELTLTAYPPEDLLLRPALDRRIMEALEVLLTANLPVYLVVGHPYREQGKLYNALSVIYQGRLVARYFKQNLPNYQVFDERRYFTPGKEACLLTVNNMSLAFTICEDLWGPEPARQAAQKGAELLINLNASPFHSDKFEQRLSLLQQRAREGGLPIVYVNLVGGQDELVFDGNSMVTDNRGQVAVPGPAFDEALIPVHFVRQQGVLTVEHFQAWQPTRSPEHMQEERCYEAMKLGLRDYVEKNGFRSAVLGLSGGIDSALTLAVAVDALGAEQVSAIMMPYAYTSQLSLKLASQQAARLGVHYRVIPIGDAFQAFTDALSEEFAGLPADLTEQNIQARCRGIILMAISNKKGSLVLTTGNKSEIAVGYCTLYGDMAGGFDVLKDASKTLVYRLARYRNRVAVEQGEAAVIPQDVIDRPPSAELAPGQKDEDNLPSYDRLDQILAMYVEQDKSASQIIASGFDQEEVYRVLHLVDLNEYKRRQAAIGVRLTPRAFGRDRRYPISQAWQAGD